jgi:hypothetical protein
MPDRFNQEIICKSERGIFEKERGRDKPATTRHMAEEEALRLGYLQDLKWIRIKEVEPDTGWLTGREFVREITDITEVPGSGIFQIPGGLILGLRKIRTYQISWDPNSGQNINGGDTVDVQEQAARGADRGEEKNSH